MMRKYLYILFLLISTIALGQRSSNQSIKNLKVDKKSRLIEDVTIGSSSFNASAILGITSTTKGILIPRMTTVQRDAISTPATSLMIYNTTTNQFEFFEITWQAVGGGGDMLISAYDNNNDSIVNNSDSLNSQPPSFYLARTNHTGTQTASTISDFQTTVTANSDVTTNTAKVTNATHTGDVTGATALTIANKAVEIVMLDDGTDGELITWDASGVSATVATGTSGQILTSNGVGTSPTFEDAAGGNTIYSADDNLAGNRIVTMGANSLTFSGNLTTFKGIDATGSNFVADFEDNVGTKLLRIRNDNKTIIGGSTPVFSSPLTVEGAAGISLFKDDNGGGVTIHYHLKNSVGTIFRYAFVSGNVLSNVAGSENGFVELGSVVNGVLKVAMRVSSDLSRSIRMGDVTALSAGDNNVVIKAGNSNDGNIVGLQMQNTQANTGGSTNETVSINATFGGVNNVAFLLFGKTADFTSNPNRSTFFAISTMDASSISERMRIDNKGNMGIGTTTPAISAKLEISSTTGAVLFPRMTTAQRDALTAVNGMVVYNSTLDKLQVRAAGAWVSLH